MQMTPAERDAFAHLLTAVRNGRFKGNRKAAYTAAGVNSATWTRAEEGESIKEHSVSKIVSSLFPRTGGDWRELQDEKGNFRLNYWDRNGLAEARDLERVLGITEWGGANDVEDLAGVNKELSGIRTRLEQLAYRLGKLEEHLDFDPFADFSIEKVDGPPIPNYFMIVDDEDQVAALDDPDDRPDDPEE